LPPGLAHDAAEGEGGVPPLLLDDVRVAVDADGVFTEDPFSAIGVKVFGGHRGTGLAIMIDLLAGAIGSASAGQENYGRWGVIAIILRAGSFRAEESYLRDIRQTLDNLKSALPSQGEGRYPGSEAEKNLRRSLRQGYISLDKRVIRLLDVSA